MECLIGALLTMDAWHSLAIESYPWNDMVWTQALMAHHMPSLGLSNSPDTLDLATDMYRGRACDSFDPKDRIYGLYGIFQRSGLRLPPPSYLKSKSEIYWEFTVAACEQTSSAKLITLVTGLSADLDAPSWVPDFAEPFRVGDRCGRKAPRVGRRRFFASPTTAASSSSAGKSWT